MALFTAFSQSPRCRLSFSECALVYGSSTPMSSAGHAAQLARERLDERDRAAAADGDRVARHSPSSARERRPGTRGGSNRCTTSPRRASALTLHSRPHGVASFSALMSFRLHVVRVHVGHDAECRPAPTPSRRRCCARPCGELAWKALMAIEGCRQLVSQGCVRRPSISTPREEARPASRKCASSPGSAAMLFRSASVRGFTLSAMPGMAIVPSGLVSEAEHPAERHDRVGHRAAPHAGVNRLPERADLDLARDEPAQRGGDRRQAGLEIVGVGEHDGVGRPAAWRASSGTRRGARIRSPPRLRR